MGFEETDNDVQLTITDHPHAESPANNERFDRYANYRIPNSTRRNRGAHMSHHNGFPQKSARAQAGDEDGHQKTPSIVSDAIPDSKKYLASNADIELDRPCAGRRVVRLVAPLRLALIEAIEELLEANVISGSEYAMLRQRIHGRCAW